MLKGSAPPERARFRMQQRLENRRLRFDPPLSHTPPMKGRPEGRALVPRPAADSIRGNPGGRGRILFALTAIAALFCSAGDRAVYLDDDHSAWERRIAAHKALAASTRPPATATDSSHNTSSPWFEIQVVDDRTERGVPLVELRTVNHLLFVTDNAGRVAFGEPGLMHQEVFFHVFSHGYEYAADGFGYRGVRLKPAPGERAIIRLPRRNIAERLYRMTGEGLYRDSLLLGHPAPLRRPLLNGQVLGQDTVVVSLYRGRLYWFWGDTDRAAYPLGNFAASGATSRLPGAGGLDPSVGVDLEYFVDVSGFSKPMCPDFGDGLHWIESVMAVSDGAGKERLVARVSSQRGLVPAHAWHLAVFNDDKEVFESIVKWDLAEGHDAAHPFRTRIRGREYFYLYPNLRVPATLEALKDLRQYEAFTCVAGDGQFQGASTAIERDSNGRVRYSWKAGATRLHAGRLRELVRGGQLKRGECWLALTDIETGSWIEPGRGSVFWNELRGRWILLVSQHPGEIWFAEADTPTGPWAYARRVVTHENYTFYNPTQHPFFDQQGGRWIYFEGTYTDAFSGAKAKTPRYNYNQVMYRLDLADPRLVLPVAIYRLTDGRLADRRALLQQGDWLDAVEVAHFALPDAHPPAAAPGAAAPAARLWANPLDALILDPEATPSEPMNASRLSDGFERGGGFDLTGLRL
jgi:hypothetical protein